MTDTAARSEAARAASRQNGRRSKGPKTVLGRQVSARNAFKHGLRSRQTIAPGILPTWAMMIELKLRATIGTIGQNRREHLDRLLPLIMQIDQVDRLIAGELAKLHAALVNRASLGVADFDFAALQTLFNYRRRFSAARDKCLVQLTKYGFLFPFDREKLTGKRSKKRKRRLKQRPAPAGGAEL